jgi:hypothetical protein
MLTIDAARLEAELEQLATFSEAEPPAVTRVVSTEADLRFFADQESHEVFARMPDLSPRLCRRDSI